MELRYDGHTAAITGGAGSIGLAVAELLAEAGAGVALLDISPEVVARAATVSARGGRASGHLVDVTDVGSVTRAFAAVASSHGPVDMLINCAGIVVRRDGVKLPAEELDVSDWRRSIDINLTSVFLCARAVLPAMKASGWGRIVTMSSQGGRTGGAFSSVDYGAAKAAVIGFSRTLAVEVGRAGITVNCVAPGRVVTPMTSHASELEQNNAFIDSLPVQRFASTDEIAAVVGFLCSDRAGYITGATVDVNGGGFML